MVQRLIFRVVVSLIDGSEDEGVRRSQLLLAAAGFLLFLLFLFNVRRPEVLVVQGGALGETVLLVGDRKLFKV